ncbi:PREDICTED: uncharacterized protein LOC109239428 [Nicotiana attenuata]|uniref:uncharacterized protein LOC109239428 n=1 Tax=Nicotiana attenuata TaxID=49451 RepID=UPI0009055CB8|nr:PREDICTED: uncharacterized protein LOC109239428 [Nicotiana attenuata]
MEEENTQILEINLISAQSLKTPITDFRRMQTYALLWVDSSNKLRTKIDHFGGENPTWNDKFHFCVSPKFFSGDTFGVSVEIYVVGVLKDFLVGTVRLLLSSYFKGMVNREENFGEERTRSQSRRQAAPQPEVVNTGQPQATMPEQVQEQVVDDTPPPVPDVVPTVTLPADAVVRLLNVLEALVPTQGGHPAPQATLQAQKQVQINVAAPYMPSAGRSASGIQFREVDEQGCHLLLGQSFQLCLWIGSFH